VLRSPAPGGEQHPTTTTTTTTTITTSAHTSPTLANCHQHTPDDRPTGSSGGPPTRGRLCTAEKLHRHLLRGHQTGSSGWWPAGSLTSGLTPCARSCLPCASMLGWTSATPGQHALILCHARSCPVTPSTPDPPPEQAHHPAPAQNTTPHHTTPHDTTPHHTTPHHTTPHHTHCPCHTMLQLHHTTHMDTVCSLTARPHHANH
jgi:hypothetical protein